jgi:hypothetical protein
MKRTAIRIEESPDAAVLARVAPFVSCDPTKHELRAPWGVEIDGRGYVVATDAHRAAFEPCADWEFYRCEGVPPIERMFPLDVEYVGEIKTDALLPLRLLPKDWGSTLFFDRGSLLLSARVTRRQRKKEETLQIFKRAPIEVAMTALPWPLQEIGIDAKYLLDAVKYIGTPGVHMWTNGRGPCDPIAFTSTGAGYADGQRFMIVMPVAE